MALAAQHDRTDGVSLPGDMQEVVRIARNVAPTLVATYPVGAPISAGDFCSVGVDGLIYPASLNDKLLGVAEADSYWQDRFWRGTGNG